MSDGWLVQLRDRGVLAVGKALGLQEIRRWSLSPCPSCGRTKRGSHDHRGPIGIRRDNAGWVCHRCEASGDPITLAAWVVEGQPKPFSWRRIWIECCDAGLCDGPYPSPRPQGHTLQRKPISRLLPKPTPYVPRYPPASEIRKLWERCVPVTRDIEVAAWLAGRCLDPEAIAYLDLVRCLPMSSVQLPSWARMGLYSWAQSSHRIIVRFWNAHGDPVTLHARATKGDAKPKGISPRGFDIQGTVMADRQGWELLRSASTERQVLIAEGVPDWLVWSTWAQRKGSTAPAVLGVISGSWTDDIAKRIPDRTRVLVRTHPDKAGHKYADKITASLISRCKVLRRAPADDKGNQDG